MSRIRGKDTKIEKIVEAWLSDNKLKFRKHYTMVGNPDFVLLERKIAIFVDGDFWHGYRMGPKRLATMKKFWREKISKNKSRDRRVNRSLKNDGWTIVRIWEHEIVRRQFVDKLKNIL